MKVTHDDTVRIKINNESIFLDGPNVSYRLFQLNQKYINVEFSFWENNNTEKLYFDFFIVHSTPGLEIAEPIMPSITLPTPNSVNSGKVLVSNGSGYALENSGARNQSYIFLHSLSANKSLTDGQDNLIDNWNENNIVVTDGNFSYSSGTITIKNIGKYKVSSTLTFGISGNNPERWCRVRVYINDTWATNTHPESLQTLAWAEGTATQYGNLNIFVIIETTQMNTTVKLRARSEQESTAIIQYPGAIWMIEDMTPSAVPSINVPLPVAANSGQLLSVNQSGTGLEYGVKIPFTVSTNAHQQLIVNQDGTGLEYITGNHYYKILGVVQTFLLQDGWPYHYNRTKWKWAYTDASKITKSNITLISWVSETNFRFNYTGRYKITLYHVTFADDSQATRGLSSSLGDTISNTSSGNGTLIMSTHEHNIAYNSGYDSYFSVTSVQIADITSTSLEYNWGGGSGNNSGVYHRNDYTYFIVEKMLDYIN